MVCQYTAVLNQDIEKLSLQNEDNGYQHQCQWTFTDHQKNTCKKRYKLGIITLGLIGFTFIGHFFGSHCRGTVLASSKKQQQQLQMSDQAMILSSSPFYNTNHVLAMNNLIGRCSDDIPFHPWDGKSVYHVPQTIKSVHVVEKAINSNTYFKGGKVNVVENKELALSRITFDIKLNDETLDDIIRIEEEKTEDDYRLSIVHERQDRSDEGCIQINALIELPSVDALESLGLEFIDNNITIKDNFDFKNSLQLSTIEGDLTVDKKIKGTSIQLKNVNGDIQGEFDLNQGEFITNTIQGHVNISFDHVSPGSTIETTSVNGQVDLQMPNDFESKFQLTTTFGKIMIEATSSDLLHYRRINHAFGQKIKGNYGEDENTSSEINVSTISGHINLNYQ